MIMVKLHYVFDIKSRVGGAWARNGPQAGSLRPLHYGLCENYRYTKQHDTVGAEYSSVISELKCIHCISLCTVCHLSQMSAIMKLSNGHKQGAKQINIQTILAFLW